MAYFIRTRGDIDPGMLVEMPARHARHCEQPGVHYQRIDARRAHRWVLADQPHETLLFVTNEDMAKFPYTRRVVRRA